MKIKILVSVILLLVVVGVSIVSFRPELLQGFLSYKVTPVRIPDTPLKVNVNRVKLSPDVKIEVCDNGIDDDKNSIIDCQDAFCSHNDSCVPKNGKKMCLLDDKKEISIFTDYENISQYKYSRMYVVKDEATCKKITAEGYGKVAPTVSLKTEGFPAYDKVSDDNNIRVVCQEPCEVSSVVLDWRLKQLQKMFVLLEKTVGTKIWNKTVIFYVGVSPTLEKESDVTVPTGGNGSVYLFDGERFLLEKDKLSFDQSKVLHLDYPDMVYLRTFENENDPIHELIHNVFSKYGGFSYYIEESFTQFNSAMLGGASQDLKFPAGREKPDTYCDKRFENVGYPLLYHLCKENGFDIDDLPQFFTALDAFYLKKGSQMTDDELIQVMSGVVGKNVAPLFEKYKN